MLFFYPFRPLFEKKLHETPSAERQAKKCISNGLLFYKSKLNWQRNGRGQQKRNRLDLLVDFLQLMIYNWIQSYCRWECINAWSRMIDSRIKGIKSTSSQNYIFHRWNFNFNHTRQRMNLIYITGYLKPGPRLILIKTVT